MLFNSYEFIFIFLPCVLLVFSIATRWQKWALATGVLVVASLFFYGYWNYHYLVLIVVSALGNYLVASLVISLNNAHEKEYIAKAISIVGICINLLAIAYYKYQEFFLEIINAIFKLDIDIPQIILPLAISFFTFQQIAYLVDVCRRKISVQHNFWQYCLFVTFFPQLIAGPIVRYQELMPQLSWKENYQINAKSLALGLSIFSIGLFKKFLADAIAVYGDPVFTIAHSGEVLSFFEAWYGALAYTVQLYFDFSGYSDMAIGLGSMFGIRLPLNFFSPYKAVSIIDFWRRWHMTLSRFLRDYLYIPLGGSRAGEVRRYINIVITMLLGGLWHGAGWTFILWGGLHGMYLSINHCWRYLVEKLELSQRLNPSWFNLIGKVVTFVAVVVAWVLFRAETLEVAVQMLYSMAHINEFHSWTLLGSMFTNAAACGAILSVDCLQSLSPNALIKLPGLGLLTTLLIFVWFLPNTQQIFEPYHPTILTYDIQIDSKVEHYPKYFHWQPGFTWICIIIIMNLISFSVLASIPSNFLYFQF